MSKRTVKQHYVPCCYLANFGINGNKSRDSLIFAFDINNKSISQGKVETYAYGNDFYYVDSFPDPNLMENFFSMLEGKYSENLRKVISLPKSETITFTEKEELAAQFAYQYVRTIEHRNIYDNIINQLKKTIPEDVFAKTDKDYKHYLREIHINELLSGESANFFANMLLDRTWIIWRNETATPFYTSDNPVCVIYHTKKRVAIVAKETEIYIPISPSIAISAYHKDLNKSIGDRSVAAIIDRRAVDGFNTHIAQNCSRFVFSNKNSFDSFLNVKSLL